MTIVAITAGCAGNEVTASPTQIPLPATSADTIQPTPEPSPSPRSEPVPLTNINVDGLGDDWTGRSVQYSDPLGDMIDGYLDLGDGYAFATQYFGDVVIIDVNPPETAHVETNFEIIPHGEALVYSDGYLYISDYKNGIGVYKIFE